jgi:hypothetical protein
MFLIAPNAATNGGGPGAVPTSPRLRRGSSRIQGLAGAPRVQAGRARNVNIGGHSAPPASGILGLTVYPNLIRPCS